MYIDFRDKTYRCDLDMRLDRYLRIRRNPVVGELLSVQNLKKIRDWMEECDSSSTHTDCKPDSFIPSRLVEIDRDGGSARLILTSDDSRFASLQDVPHYFALSYCWGPEETMKRYLHLDRQTLDQMSSGIDVKALAPTHQDALRATKVLGCDFVWIDAL
jgi:hypothetical protein